MKTAIAILTLALVGFAAPANGETITGMNLKISGGEEDDVFKVMVSKDGRTYDIRSNVPLATNSTICWASEAGTHYMLHCPATAIAGFEINGGGGDDKITLFRVPVPATLWGWTGSDILEGGTADDKIMGGPGDDILRGNGGADVLRGEGGADLLGGGPGGDKIEAGAGNDILTGAAGDDELRGALGNDRLSGGPGDDRLFGGPGIDLLVGGPGKNVLRQ